MGGSGCADRKDDDGVRGTGVSSYDISLEKQEVLVKGTIGYDDLHAKIAKTGKQVCPLSRFRETRCRASVRRRLTGVARSSPARRLNEGANLLDGLRATLGTRREAIANVTGCN